LCVFDVRLGVLVRLSVYIIIVVQKKNDMYNIGHVLL